MWMTRLAVLAGCAGALALAGCVTRAPVVPRGETARLVLESPRKFHEATVEFNGEVVVTLPPVPADQAWQISQHDPRFLKQLTALRPPAEPGAGSVVSFLAIRTGRTRLQFALVAADGRRETELLDQQLLTLTIE